MPYKYKEQQKQYQKRWAINTKEVRRKNQQRRRQDIQNFVWSIKEKLSCEICGENDPRCLDFHHIDQATKDFSIADAIRNKLSNTKILAEIEKCKVLCANCHRKEHYKLSVMPIGSAT